MAFFSREPKLQDNLSSILITFTAVSQRLSAFIAQKEEEQTALYDAIKVAEQRLDENISDVTQASSILKNVNKLLNKE